MSPAAAVSTLAGRPRPRSRVPAVASASATASARSQAPSPRLWAWPGYAVLGAGTGLALLDPGLVVHLRYVPLVASLVLLGMPHGAVDHLIPGWVRGRPLGRRDMARLLGAYVGVTLVGIAVWLVAPLAAVALFFAVTIVHWGVSELAWFPRAARPRLFALARGAVIVVLPALAHPRAFDVATASLLSPFLAHPPALAPAGSARLIAAVALGALCLLGAGSGRARLELIGLVACFALVDPVFAVGLYFIAWHSWRHVVRLTTVEPGAAARLRDGRPLAAVGRVLWAAVPCSALALAGLGGFGLLVAIHFGSSQQVVAVALALIAALTVPHTVVVAWLDRQAGAFSARG